MSKRAPEEALNDLHADLAKALAREVQSENVSPAMLNVARQFLKDNHIEGVATPKSPLANLADSLPDFDEAEPYQH